MKGRELLSKASRVTKKIEEAATPSRLIKKMAKKRKPK